MSEPAKHIIAAINADLSFGEVSITDLMAMSNAGYKRCHIIVVVGPIGYGKTTAAVKIADTLGVTPVDGDFILGHYATGFGQERGMGTLSECARAIMRDGLLVISCGGGVLGDTLKRVWTYKLESWLQTMFPAVSFQTTVVVPGEYWGEVPPSKEEIGRIYADQAQVIEAVKGRQEREDPHWMGANPQEVAVASRNNGRFALSLVDIAPKVFTFPRSIQGEMAEIPDRLFNGITPMESPEDTVVVCQFRTLYEEFRGHHETNFFDKKGLPVTASDFGVDLSPQSALKLTVGGANGCSLVVLTHRENKTQHITLNPGKISGSTPRPPVKMREVARHYTNGVREEVSIGGGDVIDLSEDNITVEEITVTPIGVIAGL